MDIYRLINYGTKTMISQFTAESSAEANEVASLYYLERGIRVVAKKQERRWKILVAMQHALSEEQTTQIVECTRGTHPFEVEYLKEINPSLFERLSSLDGSEVLSVLANNLVRLLHGGDYIGVILPIGSPAFMAEFVTVAHTEWTSVPAMVFAHSDRISVDNGDGTKTTKFVHKGWIGAGTAGKMLALDLNNGRVSI